MENKYLNEVTKLLGHVHPRLIARDRITFKDVFGAVAGYGNGHIFITCGKFGIALRLPRDVLDQLFKEKGVKHLKYFPNGHIKKEYAVLPKRILEDRLRLGLLFKKSIEYVLLP